MPSPPARLPWREKLTVPKTIRSAACPASSFVFPVPPGIAEARPPSLRPFPAARRRRTPPHRDLPARTSLGNDIQSHIGAIPSAVFFEMNSSPGWRHPQARGAPPRAVLATPRIRTEPHVSTPFGLKKLPLRLDAHLKSAYLSAKMRLTLKIAHTGEGTCQAVENTFSGAVRYRSFYYYFLRKERRPRRTGMKGPHTSWNKSM